MVVAEEKSEGELTDESIHGVCSGSNYHTHDDNGRSRQRSPASTDQIGYGTHKGRDCRKGQKMSENVPDVSILSADVSIDVGRTGSFGKHMSVEMIGKPLDRHPLSKLRGEDSHRKGTEEFAILTRERTWTTLS